MQGEGQLDRAEVRAEVARVRRDRGDDEVPDLRSQRVELGVVEPPQIAGRVDAGEVLGHFDRLGGWLHGMPGTAELPTLKATPRSVAASRG